MSSILMITRDFIADIRHVHIGYLSVLPGYHNHFRW
jgi:hypothetical protein